ncbi:hypothetical protein [Accumulibacter sp.]|uniref:hypothetical protein n=1 Tax=Accumulibacter sp. TaxID=2053492 RepID=UPI00260869FA|nr:hypothetical protein [Accumulibacter sp.]
MGKASGYVALLSKDRMTLFIACVEEEQRFAEPVPDFQHSRNAPLVCFLVIGRKVTHIALGGRGIAAGTGLRRLNFDKSEKLPSPLPIAQILKLLPQRNKASVEKRFASGGLLTEKGFAAVVEAVRQLAPQSSAILDRYSSQRVARLGRLSSKACDNLAYQKEAVLTALAIADMGRNPVQEWAPPDGTLVSFLDGLPNARLREDPMVVHDLMHLPGFDILKAMPYNAAVFESDSERLTVILANRLPLEEQTGTDLIYYNETFQSFVMVQYKAMEREDDDKGNMTAGFRLPNHQLAEEITRMDALLAELKACEVNTAHDGFRLTDNPFFLKLCPRLVFNPDNIGLVPGMYLPLNYWKLIEQHPGIKGPRGGRRVTYENVGRHFDNSAFTTVVAKAWVGTTPSQSSVLASAIRQTLQTGKAVAIAVKPKKTGQRFNRGPS